MHWKCSDLSTLLLSYRVALHGCSLSHPKAASPMREKRAILQRYDATAYNTCQRALSRQTCGTVLHLSIPSSRLARRRRAGRGRREQHLNGLLRLLVDVSLE